MNDDRLFGLDEVPEVPLLREPRRAPAARGVARDARFLNDYPEDWKRCTACRGTGQAVTIEQHEWKPGEMGPWLRVPTGAPCPACLGMGSLCAMARLVAGHRCERCGHPYVPKGDAVMLNALTGHEIVEASWRPDGWSACDDLCEHTGLLRVVHESGIWAPVDPASVPVSEVREFVGVSRVEAQWRILTVHHLDGNKENCQPYNLAALCQRDHLEVQAKVVMERVYPGPHSPWFRWHAAGYYAEVYLGLKNLTRAEIEDRMDEFLALELDPSYG